MAEEEKSQAESPKTKSPSGHKKKKRRRKPGSAPVKHTKKKKSPIAVLFSIKFWMAVFFFIFAIGAGIYGFAVWKQKNAKEPFEQTILIGEDTISVNYSRKGSLKPEDPVKVDMIRKMVANANEALGTYSINDLRITSASEQYRIAVKFSFSVEVDSETTSAFLKTKEKDIKEQIQNEIEKMDFRTFFYPEGKSKIKLALLNIVRAELEEGMLVRNIYFTEYIVS